MMKLPAALLLGLTLLACSGGGGSVGSSAPLEEQGTVSSPSTGLQVTASIAAVTLGDDCGGSGESGGFAAGDRAAGACAEGQTCGPICQQSNLQLTFTTSGSGQSARVEIVTVTLHDSGGSQLDTLSASNPQSWTGSGYASWNQTLQPSAELKTTYNLSAPGWSKINGSNTSRYSDQYRVRVTIRIDGATLVLESNALSREPDVAT